MDNEERLERVRAFIAREDLEGTDLNLKNQCIELDQKIAAARADLQNLQGQVDAAVKARNDKQLELLSHSERLEGLCDLVVSLPSAVAEEAQEDGEQE